MRRTLPRVSFHKTCTLHDMTNRGPRKHATGMHCSIAVVPRVITHVKMKLQLSGTVVEISRLYKYIWWDDVLSLGLEIW